MRTKTNDMIITILRYNIIEDPTTLKMTDSPKRSNRSIKIQTKKHATERECTVF
jgi:hypothetical protein